MSLPKNSETSVTKTQAVRMAGVSTGAVGARGDTTSGSRLSPPLHHDCTQGLPKTCTQASLKASVSNMHHPPKALRQARPPLRNSWAGPTRSLEAAVGPVALVSGTAISWKVVLSLSGRTGNTQLWLESERAGRDCS